MLMLRWHRKGHGGTGGGCVSRIRQLFLAYGVADGGADNTTSDCESLA